jgi:hypothetical protein
VVLHRRALGPAALVSAVVVITWLISGVSIVDVIRFCAYEIVFVALPGAALLWALLGRRSGFLVTVSLGWPLGQILEILAFVATAAIGVRWLFDLYPVVIVVLGALMIWRRRRAIAIETNEPTTAVSLWAAAVALSIGLVYLALMFLQQVPLPQSTPSVAYNVDFVFFIGLIGQALHHWPLTSPGLSGVPLHYEWFVFLHMAAVTQVTHLAIPTVALRLDYVPTVVVLGCQLLALGRLFGRSAWVGVLAIVAVFLLGPLDLTTNLAGAPFVESFSFHMWASWTISFGLMFLLALIYLINECLGATTWRSRDDIGGWVLIALLMVGASGAKATILPVVLAGTALYAVVALFIRPASLSKALVVLALGAVLFVITFLIVYGSGVPGTVVDPFASLGGTLPVVAARGITSTVVRHLVLPFAYAAGVAGVLLPLGGALYMLRPKHRKEISRYAFCICIFVAGLAISNLVHQISFSEQYFLDTGFIAGCIVAAAGLRLAWLDAGVDLPVSRGGIVATLVASGAVLVTAIGVSSLTAEHQDAVVFRYVVLGACCIGAVLAWFAVARERHRTVKGVLWLALIPTLAASALTSPILVAPQVKRALAGQPMTVTVPDPQVVWGLTPGLLTALDWMRDNTPETTVFAVSNHWINPAESDGRAYYYSAFSEREVFVEAYDAIRFGIPIGSTGPVERNFVIRQQLNNSVFDEAASQALNVLTQQYAVRYLFIDRLHGKVDPAVVELGRIVFSNEDAIIVAVG